MKMLRALTVTSRPRFWFYLAGPVLVGFVFAASDLDELVTPVTIAIFLYFLIPANIYLYGVNDVFDADIDQLNPKKTTRERRFEGRRFTIAAIIISAVLGLLLVAMVPREAGIWFLAFLILGGAYSIPPVRFKQRPFLDSISNGLYILPGVGAYVTLAGGLPPLEIIGGAWLWTMAMHTFSAIPDIEPDRAGGIATTATMLGHRGALIYCFTVWTGSAIAFGLVDVRAGMMLSIYPMFIGFTGLAEVAVDRAYWWFPTINTFVGMVFTLFGLWELVNG